MLAIAVLATYVGTFGLTPDAKMLVDAMKRKFAALQDYSCHMYTTSFKKGRLKLDAHRYYFKKPALIRLEVTDGSDKGAVAILTARGKVRAKAGGILGLFTVTMDPDDRRLRDKDGSRFVDSHLGGTIGDIERAVFEGESQVSEVQSSRRLYRLEITRPGKLDIILIDAELLLPVEWQSIRQGQIDSKVEWRNLKVNVGLQDSLFDM